MLNRVTLLNREVALSSSVCSFEEDGVVSHKGQWSRAVVLQGWFCTQDGGTFGNFWRLFFLFDTGD